MKTATLHLLRHAQSQHNAYRCEEPDSDLSERGEEQAENIDCHEAFDTVVCSPLRRCRRTLELSGITYENLIIEPLARERVVFPSDLLPGETFTDKESMQDLEARIKVLFHKLHDFLKSGKSVLLVAHYFVIEMLTSLNDHGRRAKAGIGPGNAELIEYKLPLHS